MNEEAKEFREKKIREILGKKDVSEKELNLLSAWAEMFKNPRLLKLIEERKNAGRKDNRL